MNPLGLLSVLGMLNQQPGPGNALSQATANSPTPTTDQTTPPAGSGGMENYSSLPFGLRFMVGQAVGRSMRGDSSGLAGLSPLLNAALQQQQRRAAAQTYATGLAELAQAEKDQDFDRADTALAKIAAIPGADPKQIDLLAKRIDASRVRSAAPAILKARSIYSQAGDQGPDALAAAIQNDPNFARQLGYAYPGDKLKDLFTELAPKREIKEGLSVTTPSPMFGGKPTIEGLPTPPKLDDDTKKILAGWGVDENDVKQAYLNGDEGTKKMVKTALSQSRAESSFKRLGIEGKVASVLGSWGMDPNKVAMQLEGGDDAASQQASKLITKARALLQQEQVDQLVRGAQAKAIADRNLKANDPFKDAGHVYYDQQTGEPVHMTNAMAQNPGNFTPNGGRIVRMTEKNQEQMELMQSQMIPGINRAKELAEKILAKAKFANIPQGAKLTVEGWAGSADVKQFHEVLRQLALETARIEGGSVRIPVTMLQNLSKTLPSEFSSVAAAIRQLDTVGVAAENRRRSYLHRSDFMPLPGGTLTGNTSLGGASGDSRKAADFLK